MIQIENGSSFAQIAPEIGGNLFRLVFQGHEVLHSPESMEALKEKPEFYGFPVLFPPNRIDGGVFSFDGKVCRLPLNREKENNHIHGLARTAVWSILKQEKDSCTLDLIFDERVPEYHDYPFAFELQLSYVLRENSLFQTMRIINRNPCKMPCGLGFHTAFTAPERMRMDVEGHRWEILPPRYLPSGRFSEEWTVRPDRWFRPEKQFISMQFPMTKGKHFAELDYGSFLVRYEPDEKFTTWCLWNWHEQSGFVCPEPMNMVTNEYNIKLPPEYRGNYVLEGDSSVEYDSVILLESSRHA